MESSRHLTAISKGVTFDYIDQWCTYLCAYFRIPYF